MNLAEALIGKTIKAIRPAKADTETSHTETLIDWENDTEIIIDFTDGTSVFVYHSEWGGISTKSQIN